MTISQHYIEFTPNIVVQPNNKEKTSKHFLNLKLMKS